MSTVQRSDVSHIIAVFNYSIHKITASTLRHSRDGIPISIEFDDIISLLSWRLLRSSLQFPIDADPFGAIRKVRIEIESANGMAWTTLLLLLSSVTRQVGAVIWIGNLFRANPYSILSFALIYLSILWFFVSMGARTAVAVAAVTTIQIAWTDTRGTWIGVWRITSHRRVITFININKAWIGIGDCIWSTCSCWNHL